MVLKWPQYKYASVHRETVQNAAFNSGGSAHNVSLTYTEIHEQYNKLNKNLFLQNDLLISCKEYLLSSFNYNRLNTDG